ncbi:hypothetical protein BVRB_2g038760 [Beta vulgaris subsp. vulgaris]|nr:hypothetical protein BVRB_2g038760 [Beta vulgaris subsp. vulgaris]
MFTAMAEGRLATAEDYEADSYCEHDRNIPYICSEGSVFSFNIASKK